MTRVRIVAVVGSVEVGGHDAAKVRAILLVIQTTLYCTHPLSESIAFIRWVWRALVEGTRGNWISRFIRVDASAKNAY